MTNRSLRLGAFGSAIAIGLTLAVNVGGAQAAPTVQECSAAQSEAGECFIAFSSPGESPEAGAVRSAVESGHRQAAEKYIARYANERPQAKQRMLQGILTEPKKTPNGGSDGTPINSKEWQLQTTETLSVCYASCTVLGTVGINYRVSGYRAGELIIAGEVVSNNGVTFTITNHSCEVYQNVPFMPDPQVGFFQTCGTTNNSTLYNILESTSGSYLARTLAYIRINLVLMPGDGNSNAALRIPKNLNFESQDFRSDGSRSIDWLATT